MTLSFDDAVDRVVRDVRANGGRPSVVEALVVAYDTVALTDVHPDEPVPDGDDGERLAVEEWNLNNQAWRLVLTTLAVPPTRAQLEELVALLSDDGVVCLSTLQEYWVYRARRRYRP